MQKTERALRGGLSPRVRGNPYAMPHSAAWRGSIPACAGEPPWRPLEYGHGAVYPRVCGGTRSINQVEAALQGLSPRVRGNLKHDGGKIIGQGSIPACAGEPLFFRRSLCLTGVYPRVCGGTIGGLYECQLYWGLSPRVRGNRNRSDRCRPSRGSIPACAGEPPLEVEQQKVWRVYPRVCGGTPFKS